MRAARCYRAHCYIHRGLARIIEGKRTLGQEVRNGFPFTIEVLKGQSSQDEPDFPTRADTFGGEKTAYLIDPNVYKTQWIYRDPGRVSGLARRAVL
jgi:hypothetical protein